MEPKQAKSFSARKPSSDGWNRLQWESWGRMMTQVQGGDMEAYRRLLDEMGPLLFHYVRRRVFNPEMVQDVYQEVLLTFHKALHTYDPSRPLGPWLFTVARNSLLVALGKNRKFATREVLTENLPDFAAAELSDNDEGLKEELHQALSTLPEIHREAVVLLKLKGLSLEEAARHLGISVAAVKVRAHRGYVHLRKRLMEKKRK